MDERIEKLLKAAPPLREEDLTKINALYPAYLFRRRRTREIWTSCCGRKERLSEYSGLMYEEHQPKITEKMRYYGGCGGFYPSSAQRVQEKVQCPYCGKDAGQKSGYDGSNDDSDAFGVPAGAGENNHLRQRSRVCKLERNRGKTAL